MQEESAPLPSDCISHANLSREFGLGLWGKSRALDAPYPLICHLLDTAAAARAITSSVLPPSLLNTAAKHMETTPAEWERTVRVLAGWHDIGKASCGFQSADSSACPAWALGHRDLNGAGRHDRVGAMLAWDRLGNLPMRTRWRVAQVIGGHHGLIPKLEAQWLVALGGAAQVDHDPPPELDEARRWLWDTLDSQLGGLPETLSIPTPAASLTLAVVVLADWVASSYEFITRQQESVTSDGFDPERHYARALQHADSHLLAAGLRAPAQWKHPVPADLIGRSDPTWTALQSSIYDAFRPSGPGIAVIRAPTGEGKTEAAILAAARFAAASGRHGLFFAMPTVATAEGLYDRLERCIECLVPSDAPHELRRVHSQALLAEDDAPHATVSDDPGAARAAAAWMRGTRKSLLAPFGVGTVDQVLLGALRAKHSPLRIFGAALGVLVVDEVHSLDPYMRKLLCRALEWLASLDTPVVLLSATLPDKRVVELCEAYQAGSGADTDVSKALDGYPSWVAWSPTDGWSGEGSDPRRTWELRIEINEVLHRELSRAIVDAAVRSASADDGQCVLVVRNTVAAAQETYRAVRRAAPELVPGESVQIIHSRMPRGVRDDRSRDTLDRFGPEPSARPKQAILVATQVVEQSFDVDFDVLITDPAPLPMVLQRVGRVRRHRPPSAGECVEAVVIWPTGDNGKARWSSPIYSKAELMGTHACLTEFNGRTIHVPGDIPGLVSAADIEGDEQFEFAEDEVDEAAEATLAQLIRIDSAKSLAANWAIPPPQPDAPLQDLTGHFDTDEAHPGTRHQAHSALIVPCVSAPEGWRLPSGDPIDIKSDQRPPVATIRKVFEASIPVSYPNPGWADALERFEGGWDRSPVAQARVLDVTAGECNVGEWRLRVDAETGLEIAKVPA